jgi:hypothetical protein
MGLGIKKSKPDMSSTSQRGIEDRPERVIALVFSNERQFKKD